MKTLLNPNNHLFELARSGQRLPHLILAIVLGFVFVVAAQFIGGIPALMIVWALSMVGTGEALSFENPDELLRLVLPDTALEQVIFLVLLFAPIFLFLWGWLTWYEKRPFWTIGLERPGAGLKYLRGLWIGLIMFAVSVGISAALGFVAFEENSGGQPQGLAAVASVLLVFLGWTIQGPAEEALARGWLLPIIGARYKPLLGVIISSLVFAAYHILNFYGLELDPFVVFIALFNLFLFGVFTALYTLREGSLWGVFGIHAVWNWAQGNLFGFEVSGMPPAGGMLFNLIEVGPDVVTGGPFGPEGGLAVTIILIASTGAVWLVAERRNEKSKIRD